MKAGMIDNLFIESNKTPDKQNAGQSYHALNLDLDIDSLQKRIRYLQEGVTRGILDLDAVNPALMQDKKSLVAKVHQYKISQKGKLFRTRLPKNGKKYNPEVKASTEAGLYAKLYDYYFGPDLDNPTLNNLFSEWLEAKHAAYTLNGVITNPDDLISHNNTLTRLREQYEKYYKNTDFFEMRVQKITAESLSTFCKAVIYIHKLTKHEWTNSKTILNGMFKYARKKSYIDSNPMEGLDLDGIHFREPPIKETHEQIFSKEELLTLTREFEVLYESSGDLVYLADLLAVHTGVRVGELLALNWTDVSPDFSKIYISKQLLMDRTSRHIAVVEHTKTHKRRYVLLDNKAKEILLKAKEKAYSSTGFIFHRSENFIKPRAAVYYLEKIAKKQGWPERRIHALRFTYASILDNSNVPLALTNSQLGHSSMAMTFHYIKKFRDNQEATDSINLAFQEIS